MEGRTSSTPPFKGFLYDGSPLPMSSKELFDKAKEEGRPIMKGSLCDKETPSPNSLYFSHTKRNINALQDLGKAGDIDGILQSLEKKELSDIENLVKVLASTVKQVKELQEIDQQAAKIGTSTLVLTHECFKGVESSVDTFYKKNVKSLPQETLRSFGRIIKQFQKAQRDPFISKSTGDDVKLMERVAICKFAAVLFHFIKNYQKFTVEGSNYTQQAAKVLTAPLLALYKKCMEDYVISLAPNNSTLLDAAKNLNSLKEWYLLYNLRVHRDHVGGHCAAWRNGYAGKAERLYKVKGIFQELVKVHAPVIQPFPVLGQCVGPNMDQYITKKAAEAGAIFDDDSFENSDPDWAAWGS